MGSIIYEKHSIVPGHSQILSQPWRKIGRRPGIVATSRTVVIGNLASPIYGTPAQNTLAILEPPSKIRWGNLAPCGAPLGELGTPRRYSLTNWIADLIWRCQSWLTCVAIWRACGALLVIFIMADCVAAPEARYKTTRVTLLAVAG